MCPVRGIPCGKGRAPATSGYGPDPALIVGAFEKRGERFAHFAK